MSEPMALFEARNLHLRFGDRVVLENVSLAFEAGRLSGIMGPNGAGKTTCFNVLTGRYRPDRGQVLLDGRDITGRSPQAIARLGVSRSFQVMSLFDEFTVFENVAIALPAMRARGRDAFGQAYADPALVAEAHDVLDKVGLADRADDAAKALPYGARRALEIAVALAAGPKLLFLDEPTAGLGSDGRTRLADLIRRLKGTLTIVIIEHDMEFLFSLADEISVIHWGQVIARGTPALLKANPWVKASNLGRLT
jgi:branched-chain amino acid transport system ATP-binding protein